MCGIVGVVGKDASTREPAVKMALETLHHRGPDSRGSAVLSAVSCQCVMGHTRLRVIDLSPEADQPMPNEDGSISVIYNGELYNHEELRRHLRSRGHTFRSRSDTEVVVHLYEEHRSDISGLLNQLRGMYAFAIFDRTEGKLVLARDRLGIKPMYWSAVDSDLVFGSEARTVLEVTGSAAAPDPESVAGYLSWGVVPGPHTIFCGVSSLPPGSFLEWRSGVARVESWWRPRIESRIDDPYEAERAVADALADSIRRHLIADRPVGLFLSSGVDSGAVATVAASQGAIRGITVAFPEANRGEAESASALAARLGFEHERVDITGQEVLQCLPGILQQMDQPTSDGVNTWLVSRAAKSAGFVVALSGLGGDEVFGGYPSFRLVPRLSRAHAYVGWIPDRIRNGASQLAGWWAPGGRLTRALAANRGYPGYYRAVRGLFSDPEVRGAWEVQSPGSGSEALIVGQRGRLEDADLVTLLEMSRYLPDQLLRDTDQMSMAHSLEVRVPLLDNRLLDVAFSVTARVRTAPGKQLLIRAADMGSANPKVPFAPPFDEWIRGPLRGFVREGLLSDALPFSHHMSREFRERLWARLQQGRVHWSRPWAVAVLRSWAEINGFGWV